mgnify:CR=1 FL=1
MMGPLTAIHRLIVRYVDFDGRSKRAAFVWPMIGLLIITGLFTVWLRTQAAVINMTTIFESGPILVTMLFTYAILAVPFISLHIRRYRDAGVSPWALLGTLFLPLILLSLDNLSAPVVGVAGALLVINVIVGLLPSRPVYAQVWR